MSRKTLAQPGVSPSAPDLVERHELYDVVDQLKALGLILRNIPNELTLETHQAYGLGCILERIASEVETQIVDERHQLSVNRYDSSRDKDL